MIVCARRRIEEGVRDVDRIERERDVEALRQMALALVRENTRLVARVLTLQKELATANGVDKAQLEIELAALEKALAAAAVPAAGTFNRNPKNEGREHESGGGDDKADGKPAQTGHGPKPQPKLPVQELLYELDAPDRTCPSCGKELAAWAGNFDDSDEVDVIERRFVLVRHRRQKYRCACGHCETAIGPRRWFGGGRYSAAFAIAVVVGKYLDHLPLERQVRQMARQGVDCDSNTLFDQCWALANIVRPAYDRLAAVQRGRLVLHVDETSWPMLDGKSQKSWHMWDIVSDVAAYYAIREGRGGEHAEALLADFDGYVMSDGYVVYASLAKRYPKLRHLACLVHARRKFVECAEAFPVETERILDLIGQLYKVESDAGDSLDLRGELRRSRSRPIVRELEKALTEMRPLPGSALEKAIAYTAKRWSKLTRFLEDPRLPLDNNAAERALRGPVVGRKNHYGSRSRRGTEVAAIFYSLLESAKLVGVDPTAYLQRCVAAHLDGALIPLPHETVAS